MAFAQRHPLQGVGRRGDGSSNFVPPNKSSFVALQKLANIILLNTMIAPFKKAEHGYSATNDKISLGSRAWHKNESSSKIKNVCSLFEINMDTAANTLFGKTRQAVLTLLFEQPTEHFYLREIAKITNISSGALQKELGQLHGADLVIRAEDGNRVTYQANTQHPIFGELQSIIAKTCGLPEQLKTALTPLAIGIKFAAIYGSFAKGGNHARSDIDLLVVGKSTMENIINLIQPLEEEFKREVSLRLYTEEDFNKRRMQGDNFVSSICAGPMIPLIGTLNDA